MAYLAEMQHKLHLAAFCHDVNEYLHSVAKQYIKSGFWTHNASSRMPDTKRGGAVWYKRLGRAGCSVPPGLRGSVFCSRAAATGPGVPAGPGRSARRGREHRPWSGWCSCSS